MKLKKPFVAKGTFVPMGKHNKEVADATLGGEHGTDQKVLTGENSLKGTNDVKGKKVEKLLQGTDDVKGTNDVKDTNNLKGEKIENVLNDTNGVKDSLGAEGDCVNSTGKTFLKMWTSRGTLSEKSQLEARMRENG